MITVEELEPDDLPLCPLCDQPVLTWEEELTWSAHGCQFLAHKDCVFPDGYVDMT